MTQLRQQRRQLGELNIHVKVVTFDADDMALDYVRETKLDWPLLLDSGLELYKSYGMTRGSWWSIYGPVSVIKYLTLILRGQRPGKPGKDWRQLGGDVLIGPHGTVRIHHVSVGPHDRPSVKSILNEVESANRSVHDAADSSPRE